jgi:hypothetical protein
MYLMALAVVETKTKDSWIWFLETLVLDLGTPCTRIDIYFKSSKGNYILSSLCFFVFVFRCFHQNVTNF